MIIKLNEALKTFRKERGWTLDEMAEKLYVTRQAVYYYESGRTRPNIDCFRLYLEAGLKYDLKTEEYTSYEIE